jgi:hypothetical protein
MQSQQQQRSGSKFQEGRTYVSTHPDIAQTLEKERGNYRVTGFVSPVFNAACSDDSLVSFIPAGTEVGWIIRKLEPHQLGLDSEQQNRRSTDRS